MHNNSDIIPMNLWLTLFPLDLFFANGVTRKRHSRTIFGLRPELSGQANSVQRATLHLSKRTGMRTTHGNHFLAAVDEQL